VLESEALTHARLVEEQWPTEAHEALLDALQAASSARQREQSAGLHEQVPQAEVLFHAARDQEDVRRHLVQEG
jgi:hypothetical protein